jgi:prepilin-type N-terminal cleavage/methylation domain-containing protein
MRFVVSTGARGVRNERGFTLAELLTATAIFSLVIVGMVYSHLFGMKMYNLTATKLTASQNARATLNRITDEVRCAKVVAVGSGNTNSFSVPTSTAERGNALQISPTTDTNVYVRYFLDTTEQSLKRKASGNPKVEVIARFITNQIPFQVEDFTGQVLTNSQNNRVIRMTLEFNQYEFAKRSGTGGFYDYYRLQTKISRRAID